ncbi:MAG: GNAT family N-acetyltransferase [Hyphomicrobiales bacterium]|nr:MAG: GNAT family N-acetyltransferase [Hyphomicrobiales bacterium]
MQIRNETATDKAAIRRITEAAFAGAGHASGTESAIVDALREAGTLTLSLVAEDGGEVVGHVAFSPVAIGEGAPESLGGWFGLGPVSVRPDRQRKGIGAALIREGLSRLRGQGAGGCVVMGDPDYYLRFGFGHDPDLRFEGVPPEYFMRLVLKGRGPAGAVTYQPAFYET